jgi:excisionase family DNA binding protein
MGSIFEGKLTKKEILRALIGDNKEFLTREEISELYGVHLRTVDNFINRGILIPLQVKGSRLVRFRRKDVIAAMEPVRK